MALKAKPDDPELLKLKKDLEVNDQIEFVLVQHRFSMFRKLFKLQQNYSVVIHRQSMQMMRQVRVLMMFHRQVIHQQRVAVLHQLRRERL